MASNVFVRDIDLATFDALDGRRLEIVADGLTWWRGAQLAIDTTMVSPTARPRAADHNGAMLEVATQERNDLSSPGKVAAVLQGRAEVERHPCVHHRACFQSFAAGRLQGCCPCRPEGGPLFLSTSVFVDFDPHTHSAGKKKTVDGAEVVQKERINHAHSASSSNNLCSSIFRA